MKYAYVLAAASLGMLAACSGLNELDLEKDPILDDGELVERVIFEAPVIRSLGEEGETRVSLSQEGEDNIIFEWEVTDTVGIYPDQGAQVYFSMKDGGGTDVASFDGGGWALRKGSTYSCYYPFIGNMYLNRNDIPVSFANQEQTSVSNYERIRYYLASEGTTSSSGYLRFSLQMLNTVIRIKAIGLPAGTYTRMTLSTDDPVFVQKGSFGLDNMTITGQTYSNSLEISLKNFTLTETSTEENPVLIYLTSAPVNLSGKLVTIRIYSDDGIYKCERTPSKVYEAGAWGGLKCEMTKETAIFYTSSDNNIVTPAAADAFGAAIVSNEYVGSKGILIFDDDVTQIGDNAFKSCSTLTGITIPETVTSIGDYAFAGCTYLGSPNTPVSMTQMLRAMSPFRSGETSIVIPVGVTSIGNYAFQDCTNLTSITIPNSVTSIGTGAFSGCDNLSDINIPDSVTDLGDNLFAGCKGLTSIVIPYGVTKIDDGAFAECSELVSVTIPETVTSIGQSAFESCFKLTDVMIPSSVTSIGHSAFASCTSLTSIEIPTLVTAIEDFTFWSCYSLVNVTIPEGVTSIGYDAFDMCYSLTSITIPNSVTAIGGRAFAESGLTGIIIPKNVTSIEEWAFTECSALTHITVHAINPPSDVTASTFSDTNDCLIYVPSGSLNAYKTAAGWSDYASRICDHVYVEMGNGMKWATTNVGSVGPDDLGDYFAWGGTVPLYPSTNSYSGSFTDTATAIWGGSWRMPTPEEWEALMDDGDYDWAWDYTRNGFTVVSKVPGYVGNTLFLPAAGTVGDEEMMGVGADGYYWSTGQCPYDATYGWGLLFEQNIGVYMGRYVPYGGCSVRPIYESNLVGNMENPHDSGNEIDI
ncbi:MAG: leucine-rich repeat protein [Bacteroidales bacterium]|nr:leucine-rich repeat protein [Bacteroidales bacterium]